MPRSERPESAYGAPAETPRADMDAAIKAVLVPHLRALGFKGSLPHFRRARGDAVDLCSFQFASSGGCFVVELGRVSPKGFDFHGRHVPSAKAKTSYLKERHRLGGPLPPEPSRDSWYVFWNADPEDVAREVCEDLDCPEVWAHIDTLQARAT